MNKTHVKRHEKRQWRENRIFKILPSNQIITACCIELRVQEMTMNEKLTMIGLKYTSMYFFRQISQTIFHHDLRMDDQNTTSFGLTITLNKKKLNKQKTADLVTFTEEIRNGKLYFLCSVSTFQSSWFINRSRT